MAAREKQRLEAEEAAAEHVEKTRVVEAGQTAASTPKPEKTAPGSETAKSADTAKELELHPSK